jgi:hypothetical protein
MRLIDIPPDEQAARIRAAIGHSGKEARDIAKALGVSDATLRRRYTPTSPTGVASIEELHAIADLCGVPRAFMDEGFRRFDGVQGALDGRLRSLEETTRQQAEEIRRQREALDRAILAAQDAREGLRSESDQRRDERQSSVQAAVDAAIARTQKPSRPARRRGQEPGRDA